MPYPEVLATSLRRMAGEYGHAACGVECAEFGASVPAWPAFATPHVGFALGASGSMTGRER